MLFEILLVLLALVVLGLLAVAALVALSTLPLSDLGNRLLRQLGLSGPSPGTRAPGMRATGRVVRGFRARPGEPAARGKVFANGETWDAVADPALAAELAEGDAVEIVYGGELQVTVVGRGPGEPPRS